MTDRPDIPQPPATSGAASLNRRQFIGAGLGAGAALALAGCSDLGPSRTRTETSTTLAPAMFHSEPKLRPPTVVVHRRPADPGDARMVLTDAHGRGQQGPMILDRAGRLRWFMPVSEHGTPRRRAMNLRVQRYRGEPVLSYWIGHLDLAHGQGHYEILDRRYRRVATVHAADGLKGDLHEFLITPQGTALLTAYGTAVGTIPVRPQRRRTGLVRQGKYFYCCCQEIDIASGELLLNWRSDEHVPFSASHLGTPRRASTPWDYFHMNSINVDPTDGNLIISSRNLWQAYKVDRHTGETLWRLGGRGSDFEVEPKARFRFQHDVVPHGDGLYTVFDNEGGPPQEASQSRGLVLHVDEARRTVRMLREYHHVPPLRTDALGSVQLVGGGDVLVGWGERGYFTEWNAKGEIVLDAQLSGVASYRAYQSAWDGIPTDPPRFAVASSGGRATLYVSWNGATVHRRWRVLGGDASDTLSAMRVVNAEEFETAIELDSAPRWVTVEALGAGDEVLARGDARRLA